MIIGEIGTGHLAAGSGPPVVPFRDDCAASQASVAGLAIRAASCRGATHYEFGKPRQDSAGIAPLRDGSGVVAVVCDGLGSKKLSQVAADAVVCCLLEQIPAGIADGKAVGEAMWADAIGKANERVEELDQGRRVMATTVVGAITRCLDGQWAVSLGWVGDSSCWHIGAQATWKELTLWEGTDSEQGSAADDVDSSVTEGIPPKGRIALRTREWEWAGDGALVLVSDGIGTELTRSPEVRTALGRAWAAPPGIYEFADQVDFARTTCYDDKTAIAIWVEASSNPETSNERQVV
jgi:serine/threonine protein phosphatase PrpC